MSLTAASGIWGFGPQTAKESVATAFYRHRAIDIDLGVLDDTRLGQLEVGGRPVPTFPYKAGYAVGGGATIQPRLEDTLGWLLYAATGAVSSEETSPGSGVYDHTFGLATDPSFVPYISSRKYIPPNEGDTDTDLGETYIDCKVVNFGLQMPTGAPLTSRIDMLGREFAFADNADGWTWENTFEDYESIPVSCATAGYIKIDDVELPVVAATLAWQNNPLPMDQEHVIGDPKLEAITIISRQLTFNFTVKWRNSELYRSVLTGAVDGTTWTAQPKVGSFEVKTVSASNMPAIYPAEPWSLIASSEQAMLQQVGGVRLAAGQTVLLNFAGTAIDGTDYASLILRNLVEEYAWPS